MSNHEIGPHTRGESKFVGDLPDPPGLLHVAVLASPIPHGRIVRLDTTPAAEIDGVACVLTAADIPGENQIGGIVMDEPLLAVGEVHFAGQPIVAVVADSPRRARQAAAAIEVEFEELPAVFDPRQAAAAGALIVPSRTFSLGDVDETWSSCDVVVEGSADSGGQEHLYLETQSALVVPQENNRLRIFSSTQAPTAVQRITARVLGLAMNDIEVDVARLGGAFGGKEDQATPWAAIAALAASQLGRPVRISLSRIEDMRMTGKRHPYSSDFKIGLNEDGKILAYQATYYQNAGAAADLSPAILERSLFHSTGSYFVPNVKVTALCCRTNLPPFTGSSPGDVRDGIGDHPCCRGHGHRPHRDPALQPFVGG
jgi:xanthine dehydrogenase large subunit